MNKEKSINLILYIFIYSIVDTCKKRWKYLRERYVQQKKVGDSPSYEHLSRPYLEKMKFLDNFIQQRKSYRNVTAFLPCDSPNNNLVMDIDESSERTLQNSFHHQTNRKVYTNNRMKFNHQNDYRISDIERNLPPPTPDIKSENDLHTASSLSSINSSQASPNANSHHTETIDDDMDDQQKQQSANILEQLMNPQSFLDTEDDNNSNAENNSDEFNNSNTNTTPQFPGDFLYPFYQQAQRQYRNSEQLFGELVTSELLKMDRDRKKVAQKQILEILFFDD